MPNRWWDKIFSKPEQCVCHADSKKLTEAPAGTRLRIECLHGEHGVCERLREMGFCEKSEVEKIADSGTLICKVCDAKVILSKGLAQNVMVKHICTCEGHEGAQQKTMFLSQMPAGSHGVIVDLKFGSGDYERIEEMGVTPGEPVEVVRYAPMGDPVEIKIRGYCLSLRRQEADRISVKPLP